MISFQQASFVGPFCFLYLFVFSFERLLFTSLSLKEAAALPSNGNLKGILSPTADPRSSMFEHWIAVMCLK